MMEPQPIWDEETGRPRLSRVLVVDDDDGLRDMLDRHLRMSGYDVQVACDGAAALELMATWQPDVALVDFVMPRMGGIELAGRLRSELPLLRVVMMTGLASPEKALSCLRLGAAGCMLKPIINLDKLNEVIELAVSQAKHWRETMAKLEERASLAEEHTTLLRAVGGGRRGG